VLWPTESFGVKPKMVVKGGMIAWSIMGDPNASIPTPEPVMFRPMFATLGKAAKRSSVTFMSKAAIDLGVPEKLGLEREVVAVQNSRTVQKQAMVLNGATPHIEIDPETYKVSVDGELASVDPADKLSMAQLYFIV
jgi:urease subunit alpha